MDRRKFRSLIIGVCFIIFQIELRYFYMENLIGPFEYVIFIVSK